MSAVVDTPPAASAPAKSPKKVKKATKPKVKPDHPDTKAMVVAAIVALKDRKGASLQAIKKYIAANNKVDIVKLNTHLKRCLTKGVQNKVFEQVKGHGASGRFRLAEKGDKKAPPKKAAIKKPAQPKKAAPKKVKTPKKAATKKAAKSTPKPKTDKPKAVKAKKPATKKPKAKKPAKKAAPKKA